MKELNCPQLYDYAFRNANLFLRNRANRKTDACDAVQTAYAFALRYPEKYDPSRGSVKSWVYWLVRNACANEKRKADIRAVPFSGFMKETIRGEEFSEEDDLNYYMQIEPRQEKIAVASDILVKNERVAYTSVKKPEQYRKVVRLRAMGWNFAEIGKEMGIDKAQARGMFNAQLALILGHATTSSPVRDFYHHGKNHSTAS